MVVDSHNDLNVYKTVGNDEKTDQCCGGETSKSCSNDPCSCCNQLDSKIGGDLEFVKSDCGQIDFNEWTGMCPLSAKVFQFLRLLTLVLRVVQDLCR